MGIENGMKLFGVRLTKDKIVDLTDLLRGKTVGFEAYGFIHELLGNHFGGEDRATLLGKHLWAGDRISVEQLSHLADNFVQEMIELKKHFSNLIVVFEGRPFKAKEIITEK
jgi:hypothetical protein